MFAGCKESPNCQIICLSWWSLVTSYLKVRQYCFQSTRALTGVGVIHFNMGLLFREKKDWRQIPSPLIPPATSRTNKQAQRESFLPTAFVDLAASTTFTRNQCLGRRLHDALSLAELPLVCLWPLTTATWFHFFVKQSPFWMCCSYMHSANTCGTLVWAGCWTRPAQSLSLEIKIESCFDGLGSDFPQPESPWVMWDGHASQSSAVCQVS